MNQNAYKMFVRLARYDSGMPNGLFKIIVIFEILVYLYCCLLGFFHLLLPNENDIYFALNAFIISFQSFWFFRFFLSPFKKFGEAISNQLKSLSGKVKNPFIEFSVYDLKEEDRNSLKFRLEKALLRSKSEIEETLSVSKIGEQQLKTFCFYLFGSHLLMFLLFVAKLVWSGVANGILEIESMDNNSTFINSFYFVISTISTVGYGDLHPNNMEAQLLAIAIVLKMLITVYVLFNILNHSVNSVINSAIEPFLSYKRNQIELLQNIKIMIQHNQLHTQESKSFLKSVYTEKNEHELIDEIEKA